MKFGPTSHNIQEKYDNWTINYYVESRPYSIGIKYPIAQGSHDEGSGECP